MINKFQETILIVEDELLIAMDERNTLESYGYNVLIAKSGEKAIETVDNNPNINLILMDVDLGKGIRGTEAAKKILEKYDIPIIFLSSHTEKEFVEKIEGITSYGYILKSSGEPVTSIKMAFKLFDAKMSEKENRKELEKSKAVYKSLVEGVPDIVMRFDRNERYLFVSKNVNQIFKLEAEQFIGKTSRDLGFDEGLCLFLEEVISNVFDSGQIFETEFCFIDGKEKVFNWRIIPEFDEKGAVQSVISIGKDITTYQRLKQDYQNIFNEMKSGFAIHEIIFDDNNNPIDYRFLNVNQTFEELTGLKSKDIIGKTVLEVLPNIEKYWIDIYGKVALTGEPAYFENYSKELDKYYKVSAFRPAKNQFACIFYDITEQKNLNKEFVRLANQWSSLMKIIPDFIALIDVEGRFEYLNQYAEGFSEKEVIGTSVYQYLSPESKELFKKMIDDCLISKKNQFFEHKAFGDNMQIRNYEDYLVPIIENGVIINILVMSRDITERKKVETTLEESEKKYRNLFEHNRDGIVMISKEGKFLDANQTYCNMVGYNLEELKSMKDFLQFTPEKWHKWEIEEIWNERLMKKDYSGLYEKEYIRKNGDIFPVELQSFSIFDENGKINYVWRIVRDITTQKKAEKYLTKENNLYKTIFKIVKNILEISDFKDVARKIFDSCCETIGAKSGYVALLNEQGTENEVLFLESGGLDCTVDPSLPMPIRGLRSEAYRTQKVVYDNDFTSSEWIKYMPSGHVHLENVLFAPLNIDGKTVGLIGIANKPSSFAEEDSKIMALFGDLAAIALKNSLMLKNLTDKNTEIENMLKEKELILREVHHRIKNNINSISSLLSLQSNYITNQEAKSFMLEAKNRVFNIGVLYEKMFFRGDFQSIRVKNYVDDFINVIETLFPEDFKKVKVEKQIADFNLDIKFLLPISIIINELITNIMKYAFVDRDNGYIYISLKKYGDKIELTIQDNGIGLPESFDINNTKSFGFELIKTFCEQLEGTFTIENKKGTKCIVEFNI